MYSKNGFTLVEIIVVLVILAIVSAVTLPSMLGFVDEAKRKSLAVEASAVRTAAQVYATERYAMGDSDEQIKSALANPINESHVLYKMLKNDASGTIVSAGVENGKVTTLSYKKDISSNLDASFDINSGVSVNNQNGSSNNNNNGNNVNVSAEELAAQVKILLANDPTWQNTLATSLSENENLRNSLSSTLTSGLASSLKSSLVDDSDFKSNLSTSLSPGLATSLSSNTSLQNAILNKAYPVGAYYISHNSTSPATLFGGTWTRVNNEFLYCMGDNAKKPDNSNANLSVGGTGGSKTHTHEFGLVYGEWYGSISSFISIDNGYQWYEPQLIETDHPVKHLDFTSNKEEDGYWYKTTASITANNIPPYVAVYCWRRTA